MDNLKQQATELYRERTDRESIPTSDSLAMGKIIWIAVGIVVVVLVGIGLAGGFRSQPNPVTAAATPPPLKKEAPPPGMLDPLPALGTPAPATAPTVAPPPVAAAPPTAAPAPAVPPPAAAAARPAPAPVFSANPVPRPALPERRDRPQLTREAPPAPHSKPERNPVAQVAPPAPPVETAEASPAERARQEAAREIVIEKSPSLAKLITTPEEDVTYKGWKAQPDGSDSYQVTFTFLDRSSGAPIHYVWKVNIAARSIVPLSYYSRRLS
jgi:hypothetical protein